MMKEKTLDTGDIELNYAENDNRGMSRTYHVFAPDLRGHGKSGHSGFGYSLEAYVDDVVHLMNQRVREPAVIIGAALGGLAAIGVAADPAMTSGVVLLDSPLVMRDRPFDAISYSVVPAVISMMYQARTTNEAPADRARRIQQLIPEAPDDDALALAQSVLAMDPVAIEYFMDGRLLDGFDLDDALRRIRCPALLLYSEAALGGLVRETDMELFTSLVEGWHGNTADGRWSHSAGNNRAEPHFGIPYTRCGIPPGRRLITIHLCSY